MLIRTIRNASSRYKTSSETWNVLFVEDNPADQFMLQAAFREMGIQRHWHVVDSGVEAIRIAESCVDGPCDVILLDWQLPGASGLEVLAGIKRKSNWHSVPVIMLTGLRSAFTLVLPKGQERMTY